MVKLALKTPKQDYSASILQTIANHMTLDLKIISKLSGINGDRFDWYCIEVSGTFDDLALAIACWRELGIEQYLALPNNRVNQP